MTFDSNDFIAHRARSYAKDLLRSFELGQTEKNNLHSYQLTTGLDYYKERIGDAGTLTVLTQAISQYFTVRRRFPKHPLTCETLGEKLFWLKFVVPLPIPTPADRLKVGNYIPACVYERVRIPKVVWRSNLAGFPSEPNIAPGRYFYKSNHGWRTARRIELPADDESRIKLTALGQDWLNRNPHNIEFGEWWYSTINPELYIEEEIVNYLDHSMEYGFYTISGELILVHCVSIARDEYGSVLNYNTAVSFYDKEYNHLAYVNLPNKPRSIPVPVPPDYREMCKAAIIIGQQFEFARIDFYNPQPGSVYMGEITLCPGGGVGAFLPAEFDRSLEAGWDMGRYVRAR